MKIVCNEMRRIADKEIDCRCDACSLEILTVTGNIIR